MSEKYTAEETIEVTVKSICPYDYHTIWAEIVRDGVEMTIGGVDSVEVRKSDLVRRVTSFDPAADFSIDVGDAFSIDVGDAS